MLLMMIVIELSAMVNVIIDEFGIDFNGFAIDFVGSGIFVLRILH